MHFRVLFGGVGSLYHNPCQGVVGVCEVPGVEASDEARVLRAGSQCTPAAISLCLQVNNHIYNMEIVSAVGYPVIKQVRAGSLQLAASPAPWLFR